MDKQQVDAAMAMAFANRMPCILCGGDAQILGVWIPNEKGAETLNVPLNKQRLISYWICTECKKLPNSLVEAVIEQQMDANTLVDLGKEAPIARSGRN